jgi:hypothetical protein
MRCAGSPARFRQDSERNDHHSRAGGRVIDVQQDHDGLGKRKSGD